MLDRHKLIPLSKNTELDAVIPKGRGAASPDLAMHLSSAGSGSPCPWHRASSCSRIRPQYLCHGVPGGREPVAARGVGEDPPT